MVMAQNVSAHVLLHHHCILHWSQVFIFLLGRRGGGGRKRSRFYCINHYYCDIPYGTQTVVYKENEKKRKEVQCFL